VKGNESPAGKKEKRYAIETEGGCKNLAEAVLKKMEETYLETQIVALKQGRISNIKKKRPRRKRGSDEHGKRRTKRI